MENDPDMRILERMLERELRIARVRPGGAFPSQVLEGEALRAAIELARVGSPLTGSDCSWSPEHTWRGLTVLGGKQSPVRRCAICGTGDSGVFTPTTHCPGRFVPVTLISTIRAGRLDFVAGEWIADPLERAAALETWGRGHG